MVERQDTSSNMGLQPTSVEHIRANDYRVHLANGAVVYKANGENRIELSFFSDRVRYLKEGLVRDPSNPTALSANGEIEISPLREHVAGVSLSLDTLVGLRDLINVVIQDVSSTSSKAQ